MAPTNSHHPAIALERQQEAATAVVGRLAEGHDAFPIGRGVVGDGKDACGIAEIDANCGLLGQWPADRLQQSERERAASGGVDHEIRRNCLACAVAVLVPHAGDRFAIWRRQHFLHPAALAQRGVCAAFHPPSHGALDCRSRHGVNKPAEIALWEGIVARPLLANIETGPERHGSRLREILLEPREQLAEGALAAEQQRMRVPRLRRSRAIRGLRGQSVALQNNHLIEAVGECPRGREPTHARADHDSLLADQS